MTTKQLMKLSKATLCDHIQAKQSKIEELQDELSDLRDAAVIYKERLERDVHHAARCENFIFTPEEARKQFRIVG